MDTVADPAQYEIKDAALKALFRFTAISVAEKVHSIPTEVDALSDVEADNVTRVTSILVFVRPPSVSYTSDPDTSDEEDEFPCNN